MYHTEAGEHEGSFHPPRPKPSWKRQQASAAVLILPSPLLMPESTFAKVDKHVEGDAGAAGGSGCETTEP